MAIIVAGHETGLLDSSWTLLNRNDNTGSGNTPHGERVYVNAANGNLVIQQQDAFMPSLGEDYLLLRTYNSRGLHSDAHEHDDAGWTLSTSIRVTKRHDSTGVFFEVRKGDGSEYEYRLDPATGLYVSTDGAGAYETIEDLPGNGGRGPAYVLTRADQTKLTFSHQGALLSAENPNGVMVTYEYHADRLVRVYDDNGHVISYTYANGVLKEVQDETGAVLASYGYAQGKLISATDRHGHVTQYVYNNHGNIERIILPFEQVVNGESETYERRELSFTYEPVNWPWAGTGRGYVVSSFTDAEGNVTNFEYDLVLGQNAAPTQGNGKSNGKQPKPQDPFFHGGSTRVIDALGNKRAYSNDAEYREWRVANGYYAEYHDGPSSNSANFQAQVEAIRSAHSFTYIYNSYSYLTSVIDQQGFQTTYEYDERNNLVAVTDRNGWGAANSDSTYYRSLRASLGYLDAGGQGKRVAQLTEAERDALLAAFTSRFEYDSRGNLTARYDNAGNLTTYTYTGFNKLATETAAMGHALATSNEVQYQEKRLELGFAADVADLTALDKQALLDLYTTRYDYDERQNVIRQTDPGGDVTEFEYDVYGNMTRRIVYLDANDRVDPAKQQVTQYFYDAFGNNIKTIDAEGYETRREFDHFGNLLSATDGNGNTTLYTYDSDNRLLTVTDPLGNKTINTYDAVGNRISVTDANNHTVVRVYDRNNRLVAVIDPSENDVNRDRITRYSYDVVSNRTAVLDAEGREIRYVYNARRELIELQSPAVPGADGGVVTYSSTYAYDGEGNRITVVDNNGYRTDYLYDRNGLTHQVTDRIGQVTGFRYDANLNQVQVIAGMQLAPELRRILRFRFDEEDQLIAEVSAEGNVTRHRYDAAGNRIALISPNGEAITTSDDEYYRDLRRELGFVDAQGSGLLVADLDAAAIDALLARFTTEYEYDRNNRLMREHRPAALDGSTGTEVRHVVEHRYDGAGNRVETIDENGHSTIVTYDANNRTAMIEDANGIKTVFTYDSRGNRTAVYIGVQAHVDAVRGEVVVDGVTDSQTTTYTYDEFNQVVAKTDGMGNALAASDGLFYQNLRAELGYARLVADLADTDKAALRALYTERYDYDRVGNQVSRIDHLGRESTARYDALNRLIEQTDTAGQLTSFRYDGNGNRVAVTTVMGHALASSNDAIYRDQRVALGYAADAANLTALDRAALLERYTSHYQYDANDRLVRTTDHRDVVTEREYNSFGNLVAQTRAAGTAEARRTEYIYDLDSRLLSEILDPAGLGITQSFEYDAVGNRIRVVDGRGNATRYVYDARDRLVRVIDPLGFATRYEYDGVGNRLAIVDARGGVTRFDYDPGNRLIRLTDAENRVTEYAYDVRNNRIEQRTAVGTADLQVTQFEYDAENNLRAVVDGEQNRTEHGYDRVYNRTSTTDGNGNTTTYAFDALDRMIEVTDPEGGHTTYRYDAAGNRLSVTSANGYAAVASDTAEYVDLRRRLGYVNAAGEGLLAAELSAEQREALLAAFTTSYEYDSSNRLIREIDHHGVATEYRYDDVDNRTDVTRAAGTDEAQHTSYVYDAAGRLTATVDAIGNGLAASDSAEYQALRAQLGFPATVAALSDAQKDALRALYTTRSEYDANGNVVRSTDALGRSTEYVYDANNRVVQIVDPIGVGLAESDSQTYRDARVALGYPADAATLSETQIAELKARHATRYVYDEVGNRVQVIDALGRATTSYYNLVNEVELTVDPEGGATSYAYDANGNRVSMTRHAELLAQPVDAGQRPTLTSHADDQTTRFAYDGLSRLVRRLDGEGYLVQTVYDAVGNVLQRIEYANAVADIAAQPVADGRDRLTQFFYDANNRLVRQIDAENYTRTYSYDALGNRLSDTLHMGDGSTQTTRFAYDTLNRLVSRTDNLGAETRYVYDRVGNRTETIEYAGTELQRSWLYQYDDRNRVVLETNPEGTVTRHVYDAAGQMVEHYEAYGLPEQRLTLRSYDGNGRVVREVRPDGSVVLSGYDAVGNLVERTDAAGTADQRRVSFVYDRNNRLLARTVGAGTTAATTTAYEYDAFGNRTAETRGAGTADARRTEFSYDHNNRQIARLQGNGALTTYGFDAFGNVVSETTHDRATGRSRTVAMSYDGRDLMLTRDNGEHEILRREYDAAGNVRLQVAADGSSDAVRTDYTYDAGNRLVRTVLDAGGLALTTEYDYDLAGNRLSETRPGNLVTTYVYDAMNRVTQSTDALGYSTSYSYDVFGNRLSVATGQYLVAADAPEYDAALAAAARPVTTRFAYDAMDRTTFQVDAMGVVSKLEYDLRGNLTDRTDAFGYLPAGADITDANIVGLDVSRNGMAPTAPRHQHYEYDDADRLTVYTDPVGIVTTHAYTGAGELSVKVVDAGTGATYKNSTTRYAYNGAGQLDFEVNPVGSVTRYTYDDFGNTVTVERGLALGADGQPVDTNHKQVTHFGYDLAGRQTRRVDGEGNVVDTVYDERGNAVESIAYANPVAVADAAGALAATPAPSAKDRHSYSSYDAADRLTTQIDAEGYTTAFAYDAAGNLETRTLYLDKVPSDEPGRQQITRYGYDALGRMTSEISPLQVETRYQFDALGNMTRRIEAYGTDLARETGYVYDAAGRTIDEILPARNGVRPVTHRVYDALGNVTEHYDAYGLPEQRLTVRSYDEAGRLRTEQAPDLTVTAFDYDGLGNVKLRTDAAGTADQRQVAFDYDAAGRLRTQTMAVGTAAETRTHYDYDAFGNVEREIRGYGTADTRVTQYSYDHNNRRIGRLDGNGAVTSYTFDAFGNVTRQTIVDRASGRTQVVAMDYDGRNLLLTRENGEHEVVQREYDAAGNVRLETRGQDTSDAATTEFHYDLGNRLTTKVVDPAGLALTTEYGYDLLNRLTSEVSPNALAVTSSDADYYRALRAQLGVADTAGNGKLAADLTEADIAKLRAAFTTVTEYDLVGRAQSVTDGTGYSTIFTYDLFGNQTSITTGAYLPEAGTEGYDATMAAAAKPATTRFAYDVMNRQTFQVDAMGVVTKYGYDARGNRTGQIDAFGYLDAALALESGNIVGFDQARNGLQPTEQRVHLYAYDAADRLEEETQPQGTVIRYQYSGAGEQSAKIVDYGTGPSHKNATTRYFYNGAGQLEFEVDPVGSVTRYQYDDFGNTIRITRGLALDGQGLPSEAPTADMRVAAQRYDLANRLVAEIVDPDGLALTTAYEYDARGNRTAIIDANGRRGDTVYDAGDRVVWQRDGEGYITAFARDAQGNKIAEIWYAEPSAGLVLGAHPASSEYDGTANRTVSYSYDQLNRLVQRTDAQGIVNQLAYDAAGNVTREIQNATNLYGAEARITDYDYNLANLVTEQRELVDAETGEVRGLTTRYSYDAVYNVVDKTQANTWQDPLTGARITREETTRYGYDLNNRVTDEIVDPNGLALHTSYRYDGLGNRIAEVSPNGNKALRDAGGDSLSPQVRAEILAGYTTRTYYDAAGRARFTVDPLGRVREVRYDAVGNMTVAIQYSDVLTDGELAALTDHLPPAMVATALDRTVTYGYDKADRQTSTTFDAVELWRLSGATSYNDETSAPTTSKTYDGVGNVATETDGNGNTTYFYYDSRGLKIGEINAEGYLTVFEYDAFGNLRRESLYLERQQGLSATVKLSLDVRAYQPAGPARVIEHQYDQGNHQIKTIYPDALEVDRSFDAFGNLLTETVMHAQSDANPAYNAFSYDVGGHLLTTTDARASELLQRTGAYFDNLRGGKTVSQLTDADRAEIVARYTTHMRYDMVGRLLEQREGDRVTTFVHDAAGRTTQVHLPEVAWTTVNADGTTSTGTSRQVSDMAYDANGNLLSERKANGDLIHYRYDAANQKIGSIDPNGIYTAYEYDFAGDRTEIHRYWNKVDPNNPQLVGHENDQVIEFSYDRLGRLITETQHGDAGSADDRIVHFGYDANGNQVRIIGARGHVSQMFYDGLNRLIGTVNPAGGLTFTEYDALGNVIGRKAGGWHAPRLVDSVISRAFVSSEGVTLDWTTDHATDGIVYVRRAGSTDAWQTFGVEGDYRLDHSLELTGLVSDTVYEYKLAIRDAFGYELTTGTHTFRTAQGTQGVTVSGLQGLDGGGYQADIAFALPAGAQNVSVVVGELGSQALVLSNATSVTPVADGGGYRATVQFGDAQAAYYQIRWTDAAGNEHVTAPEAIRQQYALHQFNGQITAAATDQSGVYDLTAFWDIPLDQVGSYTETEVDPDTGASVDVTGYTAYVGYQRLDAAGEGMEVEYEELALDANGRLSFTFESLLEGPHALQFYYVDTAGKIVRGPTINVDALSGLDQSYQRLYLQFPDLAPDAEVSQSAFYYRAAGSQDEWQQLPASAVQGLAIDVLGLAEGDYEFRAPVTVAGEERISYGTFQLREPATVVPLIQNPTLSNVHDLQQSGAVNYTLNTGLLRFPDLFPLETTETVTFTATNTVTGEVHPLSVATGNIDLTQLPAGDYSFQLRKIRTETVTRTETDPATGEETTVTETVEQVVNDINGSVQTYPALAYDVNDNLLTIDGLWPLADGEQLTAVAVDADGVEHALTFDADGGLDLDALPPGAFDLTVQRLAGSPAAVVAEFVGRVSVAPLQLMDADASDLAGLRNPRAYWLDTDAQVQTVETSLVAGSTSASADNVHTLYDGNGRKLFSNENGGVWTHYAYDAQGNVVEETRFKLWNGSGFFDTVQNSAQRPELADLQAAFAQAQAAYQRGEDTLRIVTRTYDAAGNMLSETAHSRSDGNLTTEWEYDRYNNKTAETIAKGVAGEALRTSYAFDAFNRVTDVTFGPFLFYKLDGAGNVVSAYETTSQHFTYDLNGNRTTATNERGYRERFHYDGQNRLQAQWNAQAQLSSGWGVSTLRTEYDYDHFGRLTTRRDIDLTKPAGSAGSVRTLVAEYDNFDQQTRLTDPLGLITSRRYDRDGNMIAETNANGWALVTPDAELPAEVAAWARQTRAKLGFSQDASSYTDAQKAQLLAAYTERFEYDGENRVIKRTDQLGGIWTTAYDAYGNKIAERDANGRVTTYELGAFDQVLSKRVVLPSQQVSTGVQKTITINLFGRPHTFTVNTGHTYATSGGKQDYTETTAYDWLGRAERITDSYGREDVYAYRFDSDRIASLTKRVTEGSQRSVYSYDARGNRTGEVLERNGVAIRTQTLSYNERGWQTSTETRFDLGNSGTAAGEDLTLVHKYDALGNRLQLETIHHRADGSHTDEVHTYRFDGSNRMIAAFDPKAGDNGEVVESIAYDGFGNRTQISRGNTVVDYRYDLGGRVQELQVQGDSAVESWNYDALGNTVRHQKADGAYTTNLYDPANRTIKTVSHAKGDDGKWQDSTSNLYYDAAGNIGVTKVSASNYGFDEVHVIDARYDSQTKTLANTWVRKARKLTGTSKFTYDVNGQLVHLNRGSSKKRGPNTVALFSYDNDGHIISRADKETAVSRDDYLYAYSDPADSETVLDRHAFRLGISRDDAEAWYAALAYSISTPELGGYWNVGRYRDASNQADAPIGLKSYVYADGQPVADLAAQRTLEFKTLAVSDNNRKVVGSETKYDPEFGFPYEEPILGGVELKAADIVHAADGSVDREATARNLASRVFDGSESVTGALNGLDANLWYRSGSSQSASFASLSIETQARLVTYIAGLLPADDAAIVDGAEIALSKYLDLVDARDSDVTLTSDYAYRVIGGDGGLPGGSVTNHVVRAGETLESIAQAYFGASAYWYLIADANGLTGAEALVEGRTLAIPNVVANHVNNVDSNAIYRESDIIGATSPEVRVHPKKKKWYQKLIQIVIMIIIVVVAVVMSMIVGPLVAPLMGTVLGTVVALGTAAAIGFATGFVVGFVTQSLAIAADLQNGYDWQGMRDMGKSFALTAMTAAIGSWAEGLSSGMEALANGAAQVGVQAIENDGKITNVTGILMSMVPGAAGWAAKTDTWAKTTADFLADVDKHKRMIGAGLSVVEAGIRGNESTLSWVNFAVAAIGSATAPEADPNRPAAPKLETGVPSFSQIGRAFGAIEWGNVARDAAIGAGLSLVVDARFGEDAGLDFFGNMVGQSIGQEFGGRLGRIQQADALKALQAERFGEQALANWFAKPGQGGQARGLWQPDWQALDDSMAPDPLSELGAGAPPPQHVVGGEGARGLWGVAQSILGPNASNAEINAYVQQLRAENPGLETLHKGQTLNLPTAETVVTDEVRQQHAVSDARYQQELALRRAEREAAALAAAAPEAPLAASAETGAGAALPAVQQAYTPHEPTGTIAPPQGYLADLWGIAKTDQLSFGEKLSWAWDTTAYHFRNSERAQGAVQVVGGVGEVATAVVATAGSGAAATPLTVPLAWHGGDSIGTGLTRMITREYHETLTYTGTEALTGSPTAARVLDTGISLASVPLGLASGLNASATFGRSALTAGRASGVVDDFSQYQWTFAGGRIDDFATSGLVPDRGLPHGITYEGSVYRAVNPDYADSAWRINSYNVADNHRYSSPGRGALYTSTSPEGVLGELRHYGVDPSTRVMLERQVRVDNVLDLTNPAVQRQLGVDPSDLVRASQSPRELRLSIGDPTNDYFMTHSLGDFARTRYSGMLVPSAREAGTSHFVLFGSPSP